MSNQRYFIITEDGETSTFKSPQAATDMHNKLLKQGKRPEVYVGYPEDESSAMVDKQQQDRKIGAAQMAHWADLPLKTTPMYENLMAHMRGNPAIFIPTPIDECQIARRAMPVRGQKWQLALQSPLDDENPYQVRILAITERKGMLPLVEMERTDDGERVSSHYDLFIARFKPFDPEIFEQAIEGYLWNDHHLKTY